MSDLDRFEEGFLDLIDDLPENTEISNDLDLGNGGDTVADFQLQDAETV